MTTALLLAIALCFIFLPSLCSAFDPVFLDCGSSSTTNFSGDNPPRSFTPDESFLLPSNYRAASNPSSSASGLYSTARVFSSTSSYRFAVDSGELYILRLHFLPFPSTAGARFNVSALNSYLLLSSFSVSSNTSSPLIKEYFIWVNSSPLLITFSPESTAFVNALELFLPPSNLINGSKPLYISQSQPKTIEQFTPLAMETVYRINVGGDKITPVNDTLWRTWFTDDEFIFKKELSVENTSSSTIDYENGLTDKIAPEMVYSTARTMNVVPLVDPNFNFNLTWNFNTSLDFQYLVRMHFCNCWFDVNTFFFDVYLDGLGASQNLNPGEQTNRDMGVPFYIDFVIDAPSSGPLNVSIGLADKSVPRNAMLNGLEIMKLNNSFLSLAGPFGLAGSAGGNHSGKNLIPILVPSILGGLLLLLLGSAIFVTCFRRRRRQRQPPATVPEEKEPPASWSNYNAGAEDSVLSVSITDQTTNSASHRLNLGLQISFTDIQFATSSFDEKLVIGCGGFGRVYRGILRDGTRVAVKRCVPGHRQGYPEFQTEIVVLSRIRHRHLVSLIGYCEEQSEMILVYELMEKGPLRNYLYGSDLPCLSWKQRLQICIGAARGIHYLHTGYAQSIIHRDVKSTNILLGEDFVAKVSDFGLSRLGPSFGETHVSTGVKGTFGYLDPEYFKIQKLTEKSDIYSFGVVLFEVLCARPAIVDHVNLAELALHWQRKGQLDKILDQRLAGKINENSLRKFGETAAKCLADYGADRPTIGDVLWNLEYALQLQETQLRREPFEDSGTVGESDIPVAAAGRVLSSGVNIEEDGWRDGGRSPEQADMSTSMVFSQVVTNEGR